MTTIKDIKEATDWFNTGVAAVTGGDIANVDIDVEEALHLDFPEPDTTPLVTDLSDWQRD